MKTFPAYPTSTRTSKYKRAQSALVLHDIHSRVTFVGSLKQMDCRDDVSGDQKLPFFRVKGIDVKKTLTQGLLIPACCQNSWRYLF